MMTTQRQQSLFAIALILIAACARLIEWMPNVAPITAIAVFGAFSLRSRRLAVLLPLASMAIGDVLLAVRHNDWGYAFHDTQAVVYLSMALIALASFAVAQRGSRWISVLGSTFAGSVFFFLTTNVAVWMFGSMYALTVAGLGQCFVMALPFFRNSLVADLAYSVVLMLVFQVATKRRFSFA